MLAVGGLVLAVGSVVGAVALYLAGDFGADGRADSSKESAEGGIPDDLVWTEDSVASVNSSSVSTPFPASGGGDSSDDDPAAAFADEGSLRSEVPAEMIAPAEESERDRPSHDARQTADGENPFKPADAESADREEPEEVISKRGPIRIPGLPFPGDDDDEESDDSTE